MHKIFEKGAFFCPQSEDPRSAKILSN